MSTFESESRIDYRTAVNPNFARRYLDTYFTSIDADEKAICSFLSEEYSKIEGDPKMIDIGCGPCIQHVLSAVPYVSSVQFADYLPDNREEILKWVQRGANAFNWNHFTQFILQLENAGTSLDDILSRETQLRKKISSIRHADVLNKSVLDESVQFGVVGFFYCAEAATRTKVEWRKAITNVSSLVEPGGKMFMASCRNTDHYTVMNGDGSEEVIPTANVNEDDFEALLPDIGFSVEKSRIEVVDVGMGDHGIDEILLLSLQKKGVQIKIEANTGSVQQALRKTC